MIDEPNAHTVEQEVSKINVTNGKVKVAVEKNLTNCNTSLQSIEEVQRDIMAPYCTPPFRSLPLSTDILFPSTVQASKIEWKLLNNLKSVYLCENNLLPVVVTNDLLELQIKRLLQELQAYIKEIGSPWSEIDHVRRIDHIRCKDEEKPSRDARHEWNPTNKEEAFEEDWKLFDPGITLLS
jgi:hypothetical protein